ncbi:MAG: glycine cleavage system aminomethyltransferase GcvT [Thiomonas sp.]|uniref:glycine cleavage system aminomethyltransferase GcvT n=1 Tax=Thiomonas sp. TaxID=2047785 RepID=UPI002A3660A0|nr:glycine cleavage system aminomethyltransferase GcvT [Thiomonas sp.]MDY0329443.1 glycine cleavage system aminomethyltransferase GcvT [Thiomonas sp.]
MSHSAASELIPTPLHPLHMELGARMVPFAGYAMPVQYPKGILAEHLHTRQSAGLFDISHMGQVALRGSGAAAALETRVPMDIQGLPEGKQRYALFTNEQGGILDDLMVIPRQRADGAGQELFLIVNAACKAQDLALLQTLSDRCDIVPMPEHALLALQGPQAVQTFARLVPQAADLVFMTGAWLDVPVEGGAGGAGGAIRVFATRSGYTGEDGLEISVAAADAERLARLLLSLPEVQPIGLGARDTLRLEAGLCLYGHDIDASTTPVEAGLTWAIQKVRRNGGARAGGFPGADVILAQIDNPALAPRRRIGLIGLDRTPVREGTELRAADGRHAGKVTSGSFAPSAGGPVAMAYVAAEFAVPSGTLYAQVRGRAVPMQLQPMPFVPHRYWRG